MFPPKMLKDLREITEPFMNLLTMVVYTYLSHQVTDRSQYINITLTPVGKLSQQLTNTHGQRRNAYTSG